MSVVLAVVLSAIISFWIAKRMLNQHSGSMEPVNTKLLQLWDDSGRIRAQLVNFGGEHGARLYLLDQNGSFRACLGETGLTFYGDGRLMKSNVEPPQVKPDSQVLRAEFGLDNGSACLRLFSDIEAGDWPPQPPRVELIVPRDGRNSSVELWVGLGPRLKISSEGDDAIISLVGSGPGKLRIRGETF